MKDFYYDYNSYINDMNNQRFISNMIDPSLVNYMPNSNVTNNNTNNSDILDPYQGLVRGNLFGNLYSPYKNYQPNKISPVNEKDAMLEQWRQYTFALIELNLYLDTKPNDKEALELYNMYLDAKKKTQEKFESMYGPVTVDSNYVAGNSWKWVSSPWPWEGDK